MLAMLVAASLAGAETERGRVGVRNLRTRDLEARGAKAGPQNFAIVEDQRGLVYLANNLGVVELDQPSVSVDVIQTASPGDFVCGHLTLASTPCLAVGPPQPVQVVRSRVTISTRSRRRSASCSVVIVPPGHLRSR